MIKVVSARDAAPDESGGISLTTLFNFSMESRKDPSWQAVAS